MKIAEKQLGTATNNLEPFRFRGDDEALVRAVCEGNLGACSLLYERYVRHVEKVITRIMGLDPELPDLTSVVFHQVLRSIGSLKDSSRLTPWITQIAVYTVRNCIRSRKRKRWLHFRPNEELPAMAYAYEVDVESRETVNAVREVVAKMSTDEQICFSLRYIDSMELKGIAEALGVSLRTAKRKLAKSERQFKRIASAYPALSERLESSRKWRGR